MNKELMTWQPGLLIEGVRDIRDMTEAAGYKMRFMNILGRETGIFGVFEYQGAIHVVRRGDVLELENGRPIGVARRATGLGQ